MDISIWNTSASFFLGYNTEFCKDRIYYGEFLDRDNSIKTGIIICLD